MVERFFLAVPWGCLRFVIMVFPGHTHLLFLLLMQNVGQGVDKAKVRLVLFWKNLAFVSRVLGLYSRSVCQNVFSWQKLR